MQFAFSKFLQFLFEMCWIKKDHVFQVAEKSQGSLVMRRAGSALGEFW